MRLSITTLTLLAALLVCVAAWSKEDQEIFRLRDEVALSEGPEVSFYDFLEIKSNANQDEINKAYRKKSKLMHPDKVKRQFIADKSTGKDKKKSGKKPAVHVSKGPSQAEINAAGKAASDRFARLGLVTNILRGEGRARYDHFLSNGFPKWKGTGYYYARFRPGVGTVLLGLFIFVGGAGHWLVLYLNWKRHTEFVGRYINHARNAAGSIYIPGIESPAAPSTPVTEEQDPMNAQPRNRRERRMQEKSMSKDKKLPPKVTQSVKSSPAPTPPAGGRRKRVIAQNGKPLVVDEEGNVYLEQYDEDGVLHEYLLDVDEMPKPTIRDTALVRLPLWTYHKTAGRFFPQKETEEEYYEDDEAEAEDVDAAEGFEVLEKAKTSAVNGNGKATRRAKKNGRGR